MLGSNGGHDLSGLSWERRGRCATQGLPEEPTGSRLGSSAEEPIGSFRKRGRSGVSTEELSQRGGSGAFANRFASIGFVQEEGWLRRLLSHLAGRFVARFQWWARYSSESLTFFAAFLSAIVQHCGNCALFLFRSEAIYFLAKARNHIF